MKILFLADIASIHTVKWCNAFAEHGHEIHVCSIDQCSESLNQNIKVHLLPYGAPFGYYTNVFVLKKIIREVNPDVLNAHYASGYGTLARLSGFHPLVLSVWGSDVYDFPYESFIKMKIIQKNLANADVICSTSNAMKKQTETLLKHKKQTYVTPFGVDMKVFYPKKEIRSEVKVIGTVKTLAPKYGITTLLRSFAVTIEKTKRYDIKLVIAGDGPQKTELMALADELGISDRCEFLGKVPHAEVPNVLRTFDIYVALSESESFGVAIIEASACGLPVVVSNVGGLPEVVENEVTGIVVHKHDYEAAANAITLLVNSYNIRAQYSSHGIERVERLYAWDKCYALLENIFIKTFNNSY